MILFMMDFWVNRFGLFSRFDLSTDLYSHPLTTEPRNAMRFHNIATSDIIHVRDK